MLTESGVFIYLSTLEGYHAIYTCYIGRMHYKIIYKAPRLEELHESKDGVYKRENLASIAIKVVWC